MNKYTECLLTKDEVKKIMKYEYYSKIITDDEGIITHTVYDHEVIDKTKFLLEKIIDSPDFTQENLNNFLIFATGSKCPNYVKIKIQFNIETDKLPTASTCFNTIKISDKYTDDYFEYFKGKFMTVIKEGLGSFSFSGGSAIIKNKNKHYTKYQLKYYKYKHKYLQLKQSIN